MYRGHKEQNTKNTKDKKQMFNKLFFCEEPREGYLVIIYFRNSVIYFLTFFFCEDPGKGY